MGQKYDDDERVILFLKMAPGYRYGDHMMSHCAESEFLSVHQVFRGGGAESEDRG